MNRLSLKRLRLIASVVAAASAAVPIGSAAYHQFLNACPVPRAKLEVMVLRMSKDEVRRLLGKPTLVLDDRAWQYRKIYCVQAIEVVFDRDGKCINWHWE
jgi:outer membrane protein assembly factor BamE (lipoprotein component of BamABCDE complex)